MAGHLTWLPFFYPVRAFYSPSFIISIAGEAAVQSPSSCQIHPMITGAAPDHNV